MLFGTVPCFVQASLRFSIDIRRQPTFAGDFDVIAQVVGVRRPDDSRVAMRMAQRETKQEGGPALTLFAQFIEIRGFEDFPAILTAKAAARFTACHPATNDDAGPSLTGLGDEVFVSAFEQRIGYGNCFQVEFEATLYFLQNFPT
jgi:hypothetical protein